MIPGVYQSVIPDELLLGIARCGGVQEYYNYCIERDKETAIKFSAMSGNNEIRAFGPFPDNSHEIIEKAVTQVQHKRLVIVNKLLQRPELVTPLPNWWSVPSVRRGKMGDKGRAHRTMVPDSRGSRFVLDRGGDSWPVYMTWANFSFDIRSLLIGQRVGAPLDTAHITQSTYLVNEAIEDQCINGLTDEQGQTMTIDGMSAPGILQSTTTFSYADWTTLTGAQILAIVQGAIDDLRITHPGPFLLVVPGNYTAKITSDYATNYPKTVIARLLELGPYGGENLDVIISDTMPDHRVALIQMDPSSVAVLKGQDPIPLSWSDPSGFNTHWMVIGCVIIQFFSNSNNEYGVAIGNLT